MPRNYDEIRDSEDRSFVIRGQTFTLKRVRPEVIERMQKLEDDLKLGEATYADLVKFAEDRLLMLIDDQNGAQAAWKNLREDEQDPITYGEIMDVSRWAVEQITGLPTMPPAPSSPSQQTTTRTSKAG